MTIREKGYFPTGVPAVPPTNHLEQKDIGLSSFYSQHRPISLTTSTPPSSSTAAFNKLFEERPTAKNIHLMDANQASFYQSFEDKMNSINVETTDLELQSSGNASRRETRPTVEEIVASKTPYIPPPPPTSQIERTSKRASASRKKSEQRQLESVPRQISYKTTILLTGSVYANGKWTFTASTSPLEKVPTPTSEPVDEPRRKHQIKIQQPFLERMMIRQRSLNEFRRERTTRNRGNMLLISVKRQRKLKMKKHKYKKLMKRTRTLRRKLDRL
ncbi:MAG: hypothetical protein M1820_004156 [Bogoriella megaspora]|nr:MAG: hypothetical protein M1820_004156 [Bogoriella megaspora]